MGFYFNEDYRIHINLSNYAWNIIHEDMFNFCRDELTNISGFINEIILNYYQDANASLQIRCDEISSNYEELLSETNLNMKVDPSIQYSVVDFVTTSFKTKVIKELNAYPKDSHKKIKLRNATAEMLQESQEDSFYDGNAGSYIKGLLEEYVRLPFIKREAIYCKKNFEIINKAIHDRKQLRITTRTGKEFEAIPFKVMTDRLGIFNYLVAIDSTSHQPVAYRVSKVKLKTISKTGKIDKKAESIINQRLLESDVSFLTKNNIRVVIKLDQYGIQKYNSQLHMRPSYTEILEDGRYVFNCSEDQIKFYFIKFGSSAVIEEPLALAKSVRNFYRYALNRYQSTHKFED